MPETPEREILRSNSPEPLEITCFLRFAVGIAWALNEAPAPG